MAKKPNWKNVARREAEVAPVAVAERPKRRAPSPRRKPAIIPPKPAVTAQDVKEAGANRIWMKPSKLAELKLQELRAIANELTDAMQAAGVGVGDLSSRSIEEMVGNITRERKRLAKARKKARKK